MGQLEHSAGAASGAHQDMVTAAQVSERTRFVLRWVILVVVLVGPWWAWVTRPGSAPDPGAASAARVGAVAPAFVANRLTGGQVALGDLKGKVVVLNFWAAWCPPCRAEMPALNKAQQNLGDKGLVVLGINQMEDRQTVGTFTQALGLSFSIGLDQSGSISRQYRVQALPTTYIIDRTGVIRDVVFGGPMSQALVESTVSLLLQP